MKNKTIKNINNSDQRIFNNNHEVRWGCSKYSTCSSILELRKARASTRQKFLQMPNCKKTGKPVAKTFVA